MNATTISINIGSSQMSYPQYAVEFYFIQTHLFYVNSIILLWVPKQKSVQILCILWEMYNMELYTLKGRTGSNIHAMKKNHQILSFFLDILCLCFHFFFFLMLHSLLINFIYLCEDVVEFKHSWRRTRTEAGVVHVRRSY